MKQEDILETLQRNQGLCCVKNVIAYDEEQKETHASILLRDQCIVGLSPNKHQLPSSCQTIYCSNSSPLLIMQKHLDVGSICGEPDHLHYGTRAQLQHQAQENGIGQLAVFPRNNSYFTQPDWISTLAQDPFFLPIASVSSRQFSSKRPAQYELSDVGLLCERGAIALHQQNDVDITTLRKIFLYAKRFAIPLFIRAGESSFEKQGVMREGNASIQLGYRGIPSCSEDIFVSKICALLRDINIEIHISHISTQSGVFRIQQAKEEGLNITASCNFRNLILCDEDILENPSNNELHVIPPLGSKQDQQSLREALQKNILDGLMRDHHIIPQEAKEGCFSEVESGTIGFDQDVFASVHQLQLLPAVLPCCTFWKDFLRQPKQSLIQQDMNQLVLQPIPIVPT